MKPRHLPIVVAVLSLPSLSAADEFGGFGGREDGYLVGRDRLCAPLPVQGGVARGAPSCRTGTADEVAQLSVKAATPVRGLQASHKATASGRTLTLATRDGAVVLTWESPDAITRVDDLFLSRYGNLAAVQLTVRRGGREVTEVVGFDLRGAAPGTAAGSTTGTAEPPTPPPTGDATAEPPPAASPALTKALKAARKAARGKPAKAVKAWAKVLALDAQHSEALFGTAAAHARGRQAAAAVDGLRALAASRRADAVEYLVRARFDDAFAALRGDPGFRAAVRLDQPPATFYERLMGFGGVWEQAGTSCDSPGVTLTLRPERTFRLKVTSVCSGDRYEDVFKGTWTARDPALTLALPTKGRDDELIACGLERDGDEDLLRCALGDDLQFAVRPTRR